MDIIHTFEQAQLHSIENILVSTWKEDFHTITDRRDPNSILVLIDSKKLSVVNTLKVKGDMTLANIPEKYIFAIQEYKHTISNKKARKKYNISISELRKIKSGLNLEKRLLLHEISELESTNCLQYDIQNIEDLVA